MRHQLAVPRVVTIKPSWDGYTDTTRQVMRAYFIGARAEASPFLRKNHRRLSRGLIHSSLELAKTPPQPQSEVVFTPRWTLKRLVAWIKETYAVDCCRETVRRALKKLGFSWKKWRKLLNKAHPEQRGAFVVKLQNMLAVATLGKEQLVYVDEAHIHLDTDEGYGWTVKGKRAWISSSSPGRAKVSFYGMYFYNQGAVQILPFERADGDNTMIVLQKIKEHFASDDKITLIWEGTPYHRSAQVKQMAEELAIKLERLPAYSPDFMPVEHL
jgi:hypothetical protein